jgi:hypothetical protein
MLSVARRQRVMWYSGWTGEDWEGSDSGLVPAREDVTMGSWAAAATWRDYTVTLTQ